MTDLDRDLAALQDSAFAEDMSSEYTPTTDEVETAFHEYASSLERDEPGAYHPSFRDWQEAKFGFRRWLAEHDRQVKAAALREFADSLGVNAGDEDSDYWQGYRNGQRQALRKTRDEIERIEKEQTND